MKDFTKIHDLWFSEYYMGDDVKMSYKVDVLHTEQTPYQKLVIMKNNSHGVIMALDGFIQVTERDEFFYHEMICHVPFAVNPDIKRVLIVGGGDGGTAREVSRYGSVERIDMVELDEAVVRACEKYMPQTAAVFSKEKRLDLKFEEGTAFVRNAADKTYDLVIVDSTDPEGPGESLFTAEFYRNCHRILRDDGILINQHESAFFDAEREYMKEARRNIKDVFPITSIYGFNMPAYASGFWYFGFASKKFDPLADHKPALWESMNIETKFYNSEIHKSSFALPNYVKEILDRL